MLPCTGRLAALFPFPPPILLNQVLPENREFFRKRVEKSGQDREEDANAGR